MEAIEDYSQEEVDELVQAVGWAIYQDEHAEHISEVAVETSGLGKAEDKTAKKQRKIEGVLSDTLGEPSVGVIDRDEENGLVDIAKPVGVVGAVVPATHPGASPTALTMMALKGRNAIVLSPSPRGEEVCELVVEYIHEELERVGAPTDLVQMVPRPASKDKTYELMDKVDLLQVTGSASNVEAGETSGTPNYCVGEGNAVAIVEPTADLEVTAERIRKSQTVDYGTSCSSDNSAVLFEEIYDEALAALEEAGGYLCDAEERKKLRETMFPDGYGSLSMDVVAQAPGDIADVAGLESPEAREAEFFMVEGHGVGPDYPMSSEKLSSVVTIFQAADLDEALELTQEILAFEGSGHSCGIHTQDEETIQRTGEAIDVARVIVNQPHAYANGGWHKNGLPNTLSEGGGTWAGNQIAGNVDYENFIQTTTIARRLEDADRPSVDELFASYRAEHGL